MSNGIELERLWKLQTKVNMLIMDGKREARVVADFLQYILNISPSPSISSSRSWREEDGVIYFSVTSDGTTGEDWIKRLSGNGFRVGDYAKQALRSPDFRPTSGVTTEVAVLKGVFFKDNDRTMKKIRAEADKRQWTKSNAELGCLICEKFTEDQDIHAMGLNSIVAMHEPIDSALLCADVDGGLSVDRDNNWSRLDGFAFAVSQVSHQS